MCGTGHGTLILSTEQGTVICENRTTDKQWWYCHARSLVARYEVTRDDTLTLSVNQRICIDGSIPRTNSMIHDIHTRLSGSNELIVATEMAVAPCGVKYQIPDARIAH